MEILIGYLIYWAAAAIIGGVVAFGTGLILLISPWVKSIGESQTVTDSKKPAREQELKYLEV